MSRVLGVDGCPTGWVGVVLAPDGLQALFAPVVADLVALAERDGPLACVGIDIPIGLPQSGRRLADEHARRALGRRGSTVFDAAVRAAYLAPTPAEADAVHRAQTGKGLSVQAYRLGPKVLDVDAFVRRGMHVVIEVHPELSFARMAGAPLLVGKKTWAGSQRRRELLAEQGVVVERLGDAGEAGLHAAPDDLLDAAAVAWTARRYADGLAEPLPAEPELLDGLPVAIWS
jgi:predicted RNase H-like nuclease